MFKNGQLASVAQLVRALHRNRRAVGSIPARDLYIVAFFAAVPGYIGLINVYKCTLDKPFN